MITLDYAQYIISDEPVKGAELADFLKNGCTYESNTNFIVKTMPWCQKYTTSIDSDLDLARKFEELGPYIVSVDLKTQLDVIYKEWKQKELL